MFYRFESLGIALSRNVLQIRLPWHLFFHPSSNVLQIGAHPLYRYHRRLIARVLFEPCLFVFVGPLSFGSSVKGFGINFPIALTLVSRELDFGVLRKKKFQTGATQPKKPRIESRNFSLYSTTTGNSDTVFLKLWYWAFTLLFALIIARQTTKFLIIKRSPFDSGFERFFRFFLIFRFSFLIFLSAEKLMTSSEL